MYAPHEAREDTVVFPALREIAAPGELARLAATFAGTQDKRFCPHGFAGMVNHVAGVERQLGIHDLSQYTPAGGG